MRKKKTVAMLLAGGQGSRLGVLTTRMAKPAVPFGGKYRIIDFPLSNCVNSDIDTVGVLTQYQPQELNAYLGNGQAWDLDRNTGGVYVLPPYVKGSRGQWYSGTANAIFQNIAFISQYQPDYVLILSGDHIYKMDYAKMLRFHQEKGADATIAVLEVPMEEASRFGIMNTAPDGAIVEFEEKPPKPKSNNASMGIYIFSWNVLKRYLEEDDNDPASTNDFGKDVIPKMIEGGMKLFAYPFYGYWKDVGTIGSLWEANMDLLEQPPKLDLYDKDWRIYGKSAVMPPHYAGPNAQVVQSVITEGCTVCGRLERSVFFSGASAQENTLITDSVIMPNAVIRRGARVHKAIIGENSVIGENAVIGAEPEPGDAPYDTSLTGSVTLIGNDTEIPPGMRVPVGMIINRTPKTWPGGVQE